VRVFRTLGRIGVTGLLFVVAVKKVFGSSADSAVTQEANPTEPVVKSAIRTVVAVFLVLPAGALLFNLSGVYPIAADKPHFALVRWFLETGRTRSVKFHSKGIQVPNLQDRSLFRNGFVLYRKNCQPCHGAPGVASEQIGLGINPKPPQLVTVGTHWTDSELFWITSHGLKMSGMPAFAPRLSDQDRWAVVAFLRRFSTLSATEYKDLAEAVDHGIEPANWGVDDDLGFGQLGRAHPATGRQLLRQYGCNVCHTIPNLGWGDVGPPLTGFAERQYIAGSLVNVPTNTMNWIMDPKKYKPNTAMPKLDVKPGEALDIAAYLYKLGSPKRIDTLKRTTPHAR